MKQLVSVVVPAYNAERTIDETLASVRAQTWRELEIIVVDDGSTDRTVERIQRHINEDTRVCLLTKRNGGVASARNLGIRHARSELVAPVDADDLWAPLKVESQMDALQRGGVRVGLVYTGHAVIDGESRMVARGNKHIRPCPTGQVLRNLNAGNFVGNGSSPLIRRQALLEVGSYDEGLREQGGQGCEDLALYLEIAARYEFAAVPQALTGYRLSLDSMSGNWRTMLRSYDLVMQRMASRYPEFAAERAHGRAALIDWLFSRAFEAQKFEEALPLLRELRRQGPRYFSRRLLKLPLWFARLRLTTTKPGRHFLKPSDDATERHGISG